MPGYATLLKESGTIIAEVLSIAGPCTNGDRKVQPIRSMLVKEYREYISWLSDAGEIVLSVTRVSNSHILRLGNLLENQMIGDFALVFVDEIETVYYFQGRLTNLEVIDSLHITIKVTGPVNITTKDTLWHKFKRMLRELIWWRSRV